MNLRHKEIGSVGKFGTLNIEMSGKIAPNVSSIRLINYLSLQQESQVIETIIDLRVWLMDSHYDRFVTLTGELF
jgi:hypothetical protein